LATNEVTVHLNDKLLDTYNDLSQGNYIFSSDTTLLNGRFEIVYQNNPLHNSDYYSNQVGVILKNGELSAKSLIGIESVKVYDLIGRELEVINRENKNIITIPFYDTQGMYLVKVRVENGSIYTNKIVNE
jgi:hypothetical protein